MVVELALVFERFVRVLQLLLTNETALESYGLPILPGPDYMTVLAS